jgi:hypothetical protein
VAKRIISVPVGNQRRSSNSSTVTLLTKLTRLMNIGIEGTESVPFGLRYHDYTWRWIKIILTCLHEGMSIVLKLNSAALVRKRTIPTE